MIFKGKRGTASDLVFLASAGFLGLFFGLLMIHLVGAQIFINMGDNLPSEYTKAIEVLERGETILNNLGMVAVASFFGFLLTFIFSSYLTNGNPVLIVAYFVMGVISIILSMFTSNLWEDLTASSLFTSSLANFAFANHVMLNLPIYIGVFFFIGLVIVFAKPQRAFDGEVFG